jgi:hypothetical protein
VVTSLCARVGLTAADLDVTELTDEVHGFGIARQISVRGALEMLAAAYTFDAVESDHQLKFKKRGREPSRVIPERDLVPVNAEREAFIETRAQEVERGDPAWLSAELLDEGNEPPACSPGLCWLCRWAAIGTG